MTISGVDDTSAGGTAMLGQPIFDHLLALTDERGLFEHTDHLSPRREHGYCVDDVARGLVVVCREPHAPPALRRLERQYLRFTLDALSTDGRCRNRMDADGHWRDRPDVGDWWGRAVWGLGVAAANGMSAGTRTSALTGFRVAVQQRSPNIRSMAFAALGAAEVLRVRPDELAARALLSDSATRITSIGRAPLAEYDWPWPEERLAYGNGTVAEALIVAGVVLGDARALSSGLHWLEFLVDIETRDGHLSVTPVGGRGPDDSGPGFDQQPIEVASLADACASAYAATGDPQWLRGIELAWRWFVGDNDSATIMFDPSTGGGYDGLLSSGRNLNQGAESTLAMLSTAQHARRMRAQLASIG